MKEIRKASLKAWNTFGVDARAGSVKVLECREEVENLGFDPARDLLLGGGSNVLLVGDIPGTVFLNRLRGRRITAAHDGRKTVEVAAGENWHDLVLWALERGLHGLENLSLIPGLTGAAPMQNIGAYGVELSEFIEEVVVWDRQRGEWRSLGAGKCGFAYRDSRFKSTEPDRFVIAAVRLILSETYSPVLHYPGVKEELRAAGIERPNAKDVSQAIIRLRSRKLPDPARNGNAGSFFKNPVVDLDRAEQLKILEPHLPVHPLDDDRAKLSAAWMIESCGWKGHAVGDAAVSEHHTLVIVNRARAHGADILTLAKAIHASVLERFGVALEIEPRVVDFRRRET